VPAADRRARFRALHDREGIFVMPNAWDAGSALLLEAAGFEALATTSAGYAWTLGKEDEHVTLDELVAHLSALSAITDLPLSVDSERLFADDLDGVAACVRRLAEAGAAGCSIEDWNPAAGQIEERSWAAERVAAAVEAAHEGDPMVLTARAENFLHGREDIDDTVGRLVAYREAGADAVYAPGLTEPADIAAVVEATGAPVNVLCLPDAPPVRELEALGVRRVSTGSLLAGTAYGTLVEAARELRDEGRIDPARRRLGADDRAGRFSTG
jgi:2-methylisocitrate lyase-like PEP mutase family enzyme